MQHELKKDFDYYMLEKLLNKLKIEGVEAVYESFKHAKSKGGSSLYSAAESDIIACCPNSKEWKNIGTRRCFEYDVRYYCEYYMSLYDE